MNSILSENVGYVILLGIGSMMAILVTLIIKIETRWNKIRKTFEWFNTAGRSVKTGILASSVVSAWTWAATFLQSSSVTYQYGLGGSYWYAAGASIQIVLFAILAIELKRKSATAHTFTEIINARFGSTSHKVFLFFGFLTNSIITAMLIIGGAAVLNSLTGINIYVAAFLIPVGVVIYTFFGGLRATFIAEYFNSTLIFIVILIFVTTVYFVNGNIGGISGMYEKIVHSSVIKPVAENSGGSYLTLASSGALLFGIINIVGNFGTVFVNQSYYQRAVAARPKSAVKGFLIGGLAWFSIPFTLATTLGLAAVAMGMTFSADQINMGLIAPSVASGLLGNIGAILLLTIIFTAVTSAGSAELTAVSSLFTYDVYRTYLNPSASGRQLVKISRMVILFFGCGMGLLGISIIQFGVSLQFVYLTMGIIIGSAVIPIALTLTWKKTNKIAASSGAIIGLFLGVGMWLYSAYVLFGQVSLSSTSQNIPLLLGNVISISSGGLIVFLGSLINPSNFNFKIMKQKIIVIDERIRAIIERDNDENFLKNAAKFTYRYSIVLSIVLIVVIPIPLYVSGYVFSEMSYRIWIIAGIIWVSVSTVVIIGMPIFEAKSFVKRIILSISNRFLYETKYFDEQNNKKSDNKYSGDLANLDEYKKILVAVDGSSMSIRALRYVENYFGNLNSKIFIVYVIEWEETDEILDSVIMNKMEIEGKQMLRGILLAKHEDKYQRFVKVGDPASKIHEIAEKTETDIIVMGLKGLGNTYHEMGHVGQKVLNLTSKPVLFLK
ncbi:MAG: sodium/solute symporter [Thaumarchaeota archaeon]|nr:sodium/solute symporter [Nitrososphaerota archaeon]